MNSPARLEVIPAIDLLAGGVVRLAQGDFDRVTAYENDPVELARQYADAGCRRLHVVDLDGAKTGTQANLSLIARMADCGLEIQSGGGIRDSERLRAMLEAGVSRAVIGSVAVDDPQCVARWIDEVGAARIILAFDVRLDDAGEPAVLTHGWTARSGQSLWSLIDFFLARGVREFLCTDVARDGMLDGPNVDFYRLCVERFDTADFIASGGVSGIRDLHTLAATGVAGVVTGKALLDGRLTLEEVRSFSRGA